MAPQRIAVAHIAINTILPPVFGAAVALSDSSVPLRACSSTLSESQMRKGSSPIAPVFGMKIRTCFPHPFALAIGSIRSKGTSMSRHV